MHERRENKRKHLFYYLNLFDCETGEKAGRLVDISRSGLKLINKDKTATDIRRRLRLILPTTSFGKDWVEFEARVVWCERDINPDYYAAGLKFETIDRDDENTLHRALKDYLFEK